MLIILPSDWMSVRINMQFQNWACVQVIKTVQSLLTL